MCISLINSCQVLKVSQMLIDFFPRLISVKFVKMRRLRRDGFSVGPDHEDGSVSN